MADFSAADVQRLRQSTGAGMMDAKKALVEKRGDFEEAQKWLREKGLASSAKRAANDNSEGCVAIAVQDDVAAIVELKCETDFAAKSPDFVNFANDLAATAVAKGADAVTGNPEAVDDLKVTLKENIELGRVARFAAGDNSVIDSYLHMQADTGKNGVLVEIKNGPREVAHDIAVHIAFTRPKYLSRDEVPADEVEAERATIGLIARNEGKPEAQLDKIIEGRLNGYFKERVLLEQGFVKDDKKTIKQLLGDAELLRFAQIEIGR